MHNNPNYTHASHALPGDRRWIAAQRCSRQGCFIELSRSTFHVILPSTCCCCRWQLAATRWYSRWPDGHADAIDATLTMCAGVCKRTMTLVAVVVLSTATHTLPLTLHTTHIWLLRSSASTTSTTARLLARPRRFIALCVAVGAFRSSLAIRSHGQPWPSGIVVVRG